MSDPQAERFRANPDTLATRVDDEIVLVHLKTDRIYVLNRTGARLWELLTTECDRTEIERRMLTEFDVTAAELTVQVDAMLASLAADALIDVSPLHDDD